MKIFFATLEANEAHNTKSNESYTRSTSKYSDLTTEERKKYLLGLKRVTKRSFNVVSMNLTMPGEVPEAGES